MDDVELRRRGLHVSVNEAVCPLCGAHIGLAPKPVEPCTTLTRLAHHFASECPATDRQGLDQSHQVAPRPDRPGGVHDAGTRPAPGRGEDGPPREAASTPRRRLSR